MIMTFAGFSGNLFFNGNLVMASQRANSVFLSLVKGISWNFLVTCARRECQRAAFVAEVPEKVATRVSRGMEGRAGAFCKCMNLLFSFFPIGPLAGRVRAI
jgi:hypothetical protein